MAHQMDQRTITAIREILSLSMGMKVFNRVRLRLDELISKQKPFNTSLYDARKRLMHLLSGSIEQTLSS